VTSKKTSKAYTSPVFNKGIIVIVGGYGSGKSEVSVNLARELLDKREAAEDDVFIIDLDIVNPYFRSREASLELDKLGIKTINPKGGQFYADLPIILPEVRGSIENSEGYIIIDVGGDDAGSRVLSSLADAFHPDGYEMLLVLNGNRPFTADVAGTVNMMSKIEASGSLKFTGIISNTHMMDFTDEETILKGMILAQDVSEAVGLPVRFLSVTKDVLDKLDTKKIDIPILCLNRELLKPWERKH